MILLRIEKGGMWRAPCPRLAGAVRAKLAREAEKSLGGFWGMYSQASLLGCCVAPKLMRGKCLKLLCHRAVRPFIGTP